MPYQPERPLIRLNSGRNLRILLVDGYTKFLLRLDLDVMLRNSFPTATIERYKPLFCDEGWWNTLNWQHYDMVLVNQLMISRSMVVDLEKLRLQSAAFPMTVLLAEYEPTAIQAFTTSVDIQFCVNKTANELSSCLHVMLELIRTLQAYPLRVPGWQLQELIHNSENSIVFLARNESRDLAAIKRFKVNVKQHHTGALWSFFTSASALAALNHPGLAPVLTAGIYHDAVYLVMGFVPGDTLRTLIAERTALDLEQTLIWFKQVAEALGAIHSLGLLHLDLKSSNIMVRADKAPVLLDFGMESKLFIETGFLGEDEIYCTPYYVSPERIVGEPASIQSDLYALGILFYEMLVGEKPYVGNLTDILQQHVFDPIPVFPEPFEDYQPILNALLAKDVERRPASAYEAIALLQHGAGS